MQLSIRTLIAPVACLAALALTPGAAHAFGSSGGNITTSQTISGGTYTGQDAGPGQIFGGTGVTISGPGTTVTITGGTFNGGAGGVPPTNLTGVGFQGGPGGSAVDTQNGSTVLVYGGTFNAGAGGPGGAGTSPGPHGIPGYDFNVGSGTSVTLFGTFDGGSQTLPSGSGTFTGTLQDNSGPPVIYSYNNSGTLTLSGVPEPSSLISVGLLALLGIGALGVASRKRIAPGRLVS